MDIPIQKPLVDVFRWRVERSPDLIVHKFQQRETTYKQFDLFANKVAQGLIKEGCKPNSRVAFLQNLTEFTAASPVISTISSNPSSVLPHTSVSITANISNPNYAYLGYRFKFADKFEKVQMYDDGLSGDGVAGDGIFGATINVDARDVQYYIYAENTDAAKFSPARAEHEFYIISVTGDLVINELNIFFVFL